MNVFSNLDLFSVGIAVAGILTLGYSTYLSYPKSKTNQAFLFFSFATALWGIVNYASYQVSADVGLLLTRAVLFCAVWQAFALFYFFLAFPKEHTPLRPLYTNLLFVITFITSLIAGSSLTLEKVTSISEAGRILTIDNGPLIPLFGLVSVGFVVAGFVLFVRKMLRATTEESRSYTVVLWGAIAMFTLIICFNFILPAFFSNASLIPFGAFFTLPFIIATAYAVRRYNLFNIKVATTAFLASILAIVSFGEIVYSQELSQILFRSGIFMLVLVFGGLIIRSVLREVEQREKIQKLAKDLEKANERLKELDMLKSEFLSLASHQLRSPLTAIKGYASLLLDGTYGEVPNSQKEAVQRIYDSTNSLVTVVAEFLDVSRIEQGKMKYEFKETDVKKLVEDTFAELLPNIKARGLTHSLSIEANKDYTAVIDAGKIKQIVGNTLDNSIKYTPEGWIHVSLDKDDTRNILRITISDSGVGIEPSEIPKLFHKFSRASDANKTNVSGTGLGMYIAKKMLEEHKGKVLVSSQGKGKGTTFTIELPSGKSL